MTAEWLSGIGGAVVSLAVVYLPGVGAWFALRSASEKRVILAVVLALVALGCVGISCWPAAAAWLAVVLGPQVWVVSCDEAGLALAVRAWLAAVVGSQVTYVIQGGRQVMPKRGQAYRVRQPQGRG